MTASSDRRTSLADLLASDCPCVGVSFTGDETLEDINIAAQAGMDIAEIRIDLFASDDIWHASDVIRRFTNIPTIATIRSRIEGGHWDGTDDDRLTLFDTIIPSVDAIDIELSSTTINEHVIDAAHKAERTAIVSHHDFETTPSFPELVNVFNQASALGADLVKIAAFVNTPADIRTLAAFTLAHQDKNVIVIGMGDVGTPTRAFLPFLGSRLTFAAGFQPSAPGQLGLEETADVFRMVSPTYAARHPKN